MPTDTTSSSFSFLHVLFFFFFTLLSVVPNSAEAANPYPQEEKVIHELEDKTARLKAETAALTARKDNVDAEMALIKAQIGTVSDSGYKGEASLATDAGKAEGMMLGAVALNKIADKFAAQLKKDLPSAKTFLLYSDKLPDFHALAFFNTRYEALKQQAERNAGNGEKREAVKRATVLPAAVASAINATKNLLSFFKTDYSFSPVDISLDNAMLLNALARSVRKEYMASRSVRVELPELYDADSSLPGQEITDRLQDIIGWAAVERKDNACSQEARDFLTKLTTPDDKCHTILADVVRQAAIKQKLDIQNTVMMLLQPTKLSGTTYTKKNIISSLGANPFHVMGGAIASYTAFDGQTGAVVSSMLLPWHGGYHSVSEVPKIVNSELESGDGQ